MKKRYGEITKDILLTLATVGVIAIASTSPYFWIAISRGIIKYRKYNKNNKFNVDENRLVRSLAGLNKNKIIILENKDGKFKVKLTERGKKVVKEILFDNMKVEKQDIWDKKWRMVIFDIPENKFLKHQRDQMRIKLQTIGFCQLQKSVWVHPYPCEKEVQLICEFYGINQFVNLATAEKIYNDDSLKKHFKLK